MRRLRSIGRESRSASPPSPGAAAASSTRPSSSASSSISRSGVTRDAGDEAVARLRGRQRRVDLAAPQVGGPPARLAGADDVGRPVVADVEDRAAAALGSPSAASAARKIAACGLIQPTRCETTIARRYGSQPCAAANRSIVGGERPVRQDREGEAAVAEPRERLGRVGDRVHPARRTRRRRPRRPRRPRPARRAHRLRRRPSARRCGGGGEAAEAGEHADRAALDVRLAEVGDVLPELPLALLGPGRP